MGPLRLRLWVLLQIVLVLVLSLGSCGNDDKPGPEPSDAWAKVRDAFPRPQIPWEPATYLCLRASKPPVIDGRGDDAAWQNAAWSEAFRDIEGGEKPAPRHLTRVKILWDDIHLYILAEMEEPHLQASFTKRDSFIFHEDNDFEVFLDPDGDTHDYFELEVNAFSTEWDLFLDKPYRDGGEADHAFDLAGLRTAVALDGTINDPSDEDRGWTLEIALPMAALLQHAGVPLPPQAGDRWRLNFSRVEWDFEVEDGKYVKRKDPKTGKPLPEQNWVWSPQGLVNMHYPERWGILQFSGEVKSDPSTKVGPDDLDDVRLALRDVYYLQQGWNALHGRFFTMDDKPPLDPESGIVLEKTGDGYEAYLKLLIGGTKVVIRQDGWIGLVSADGR